jgi:hydrogenase maturation factor
VVLDAESFPLRPETVLICNSLEADPLYLLSSGAMLIACPGEKDLPRIFVQEGIELTKIGEFIPEKGLFLRKNGKEEELSPEIHEELWRILQRRKR